MDFTTWTTGERFLADGDLIRRRIGAKADIPEGWRLPRSPRKNYTENDPGKDLEGKPRRPRQSTWGSSCRRVCAFCP